MLRGEELNGKQTNLAQASNDIRGINSSTSLSAGAIAAIAGGAVCLIGSIVTTVCIFIRRGKIQNDRVLELDNMNGYP